jgi:hypothetical protein
MKNRPVTFLLGVLAMTIAAGIPQTGLGQEGSLAPGAPCRAYRRPPVPVYGAAYLPPRYVHAGYLAPWGSIPARFYAASIPLPVRAVEPAGSGELAGTPVARADEASYPVPARANPPAPGFVPEPPRPESAEPMNAEPEAIPAPLPMDYRAGGLINKPVVPARPKPENIPQKRQAPQRGSTPPSADGPREF